MLELVFKSMIIVFDLIFIIVRCSFCFIMKIWWRCYGGVEVYKFEEVIDVFKCFIGYNS